MSSTPIISVNNLTKRFGEFTAVDHINFEIKPGQVVGYLGPNGSGKTTTIRMLLGLIRPTEGSAQVIGFDSASQSEKVRSRTGYMSQKFSLYNELTVLENLKFFAGVYGVQDRRRVEDLLEQLGLSSLSNQLVQTLSAGWRQRLALATAIVHEPQLLLLDEPTSGVDPTARRDFWDLIYTLVEQGITILVTTHYMDEAEYCDQVGILHQGKLLALDSPGSLKESLGGRMCEIKLKSVGNEQTGRLIQIIDHLSEQKGVLRASLAGDHVRALIDNEVEINQINSLLTSSRIPSVDIKFSRPVMEDVFMWLISTFEASLNSSS